MTSINDSLSQDLLFKIFKLLNSMEIIFVKSTCKQWSDIINLHGSFFRSLSYLPGSTKWHRQIAELFDEHSGSTLTEVDVRIDMHYREASGDEGVEDAAEDLDDQQHLLKIILNSRQTLNLLLLICENEDEDGERTFGGFSLGDFLDHFPNLRSLRLCYLEYVDSTRCARLLFKPTQVAGFQSIQVLWAFSLKTLLKSALSSEGRLQHLVSLDVVQSLTPLEWRRVLQWSANTFKHLSIIVKEQESEHEESLNVQLESLSFPRLQLLQLWDNVENKFPDWFKVPSSLTLLIHGFGASDNIPSISELWIEDLTEWKEISNSCPILRVLRFCKSRLSPQSQSYLLSLLKSRSENVRIGLKVEGTEMEMLQTLVIPFKGVPFNLLQECRTLVGEVLDLHSNSVSDHIEVVIE